MKLEDDKNIIEIRGRCSENFYDEFFKMIRQSADKQFGRDNYEIHSDKVRFYDN